MSVIKRGLLPDWELQHASEVTEEYTGLLNGTCEFIADKSKRALAPRIGSRHPYDNRLVCSKRSITILKTEKLSCTCEYIGIVSDPTIGIIEFPGGTGQDPIETHPNFEDFAGTPEDPENGAEFDKETGQFLGFTEGTFRGVSSYIVPSVMVNVSYYTHYVPNPGEVGRIYTGSLPNFSKPSNVRNFLLIGLPYRQVANLFHVTAQYLGSGRRGWNSRIY